MDCTIELLDLILTESNSKLLNRAHLSSGGYARVLPIIRNRGITGSERPECSVITCGLEMSVIGLQDLYDEGDEVFEISVAFEGDFNIPTRSVETFKTDVDFKMALLERLANRIYPLIRGHLLELMSLMGVHNADLPWHIEIVHAKVFDSSD